jgi:protein arginine N-methyltransferase 1
MDIYGIGGYGAMIADRARVDAYRGALRRVITPDSVVLDLGTGTGVFALMSCQLGARHVYAIESSNAIDLAREIAVENGFQDSITFIRGDSTKASVPERADIIVSDMRGVLPFFERHIPSIVDARAQLLALNGTLIPGSDEIWAAPVDAPDLYREIVGPWEDAPGGLRMKEARMLATQGWRKARVEPQRLISAPQRWVNIDYGSVEDPNASGTLNWTVQRAGTVHGFVAWFSTELVEGVGFTNAPGGPELIYGQAFFPWWEAVSVLDGDSIEVSLSANLVHADYIWSWETRVTRPGDGGTPDAGERAERLKAQFHQSTFYGQTLSLDQLYRREASHVPVLGTAGDIARFVLARVDGQTSLADIADGLLEKFPDEFRDRNAALDCVGRISLEYGA